MKKNYSLKKRSAGKEIVSLVIGIIVLVVIIAVLLSVSNFFPGKTHIPVTAWYQSKEITPQQQNWIDTRRPTYEEAASRANIGLTGLGATHKIDWGLLAAVDLMVTGDDRFLQKEFHEERDAFYQQQYPSLNPYELAELLAPSVIEEKEYTTKTIVTLPNGEKNVEVDTVMLPLKVVTFRGVYKYSYKLSEDQTSDSIDTNGKMGAKLFMKGPVIDKVEYEEDWNPFKNAVLIYSGLNNQAEYEQWEYQDTHIVTENDIEKLMKLCFDITYNKFLKLEIEGWHGHIWPVMEGGRSISSPFGWRPDPFGRGTQEFHIGFDVTPMIKGHPGNPLVAVTSGEISVMGGYGSSAGFYLVIEDDKGLRYRYLHLDSGNPYHSHALHGTVNRGDVIGFMGTSGSSTGIHLHFDVSYQRNAPDILNDVEWIDEGNNMNRRETGDWAFINPCILLNKVAPKIDNSCNN